MADEIKVNPDELDAELKRLSWAIVDFRPYAQRFIKETMEDLSGENSDFIVSIERALEHMANSNVPQLLKKIEDFHDKGVKLSTDFRKTDEELAKSETLGKQVK